MNRVDNLQGTKNHLPQKIELKKLILSKMPSHIHTINQVKNDCQHIKDAMKRSPMHQQWSYKTDINRINNLQGTKNHCPQKLDWKINFRENLISYTHHDLGQKWFSAH